MKYSQGDVSEKTISVDHSHQMIFIYGAFIIILSFDGQGPINGCSGNE